MQAPRPQARHVLVIGGTGFIGYHVVRALLADGDRVSVMCRNPQGLATLFPAAGVQAVAGDVSTWQTEDYRPVLADVDAVVFAAGVDERCKPEGDPVAFFEQANVWPVQQLFAAIAESRVQRVVLLSSVFAGFDRSHPEWRLAAHHPYIRSRVHQQQAALAALAGTAVVLVMLEVPWIFGAAPGRQSQWQVLVNYCRAATPLFGVRGGASMMSVQALAQAVLGALQWPETSCTLSVGDENLPYVELIRRIAVLAGRAGHEVRVISDEFFRDLIAMGHALGELMGSQGGLDQRYLADIVLEDLFVDIAAAKQLLHYEGGDLQAALAETVADVPEGRWLRGWRQTINWFDPAHWRRD